MENNTEKTVETNDKKPAQQLSEKERQEFLEKVAGDNVRSVEIKKDDNNFKPVMRGRFAAPQKPKNFKATLVKLLKYLKPQIFVIIVIMVMSILSTLFSIFGPSFLGDIQDLLMEKTVFASANDLTAQVPVEEITELVFMMATLYFGSSFISFVSHFSVAGMSQKIVFNMRKNVKEKLDRLPLKYFDGRTYGEILSRINNDIDNMSSTLSQSITQIIHSLVALVGITIIMFTKSWQLSLVAVATIPLSFLITMIIAKFSQKYFKSQAAVLGQLNGNVEEVYNAHKIVKAFGNEQKARQEFAEFNRKLAKAGFKANFVSSLIMPLLRLVSNLGYIVIIIVGIMLAQQKILTFGVITAFLLYINQFTQPMQQVAQISNVIQSTVASAERVFEILEEDEEIADAADAAEIVLSDIKGNVEFSGVKFSYTENVPLIEDMNLNLNPGDSIAIVGPTGAGKTTLVNLLMRFYELNGGKITIDGVDITDYKRKDLRELFGMVLQDTWLFNGTIKDNIKYGNPTATDQEVIAAAQQAHAHHFISTLEDGYDTVLNEEASNVSSGQRQLITIARALLKNPKILILDEATSSVDTRTEQHIQTAMTTLMKNRTSFVIAHRLSTIKNASVILVMNKGKVIEQGSHKQLLKLGGFYSDLYNAQFAGAQING